MWPSINICTAWTPWLSSKWGLDQINMPILKFQVLSSPWPPGMVPEHWGQGQWERALWGCVASLPAVGLFFSSLPVTPRPSARATAYFTQKFQVDGCLVALLSSPCRWSPHTVFPLKSGGQQSSAEREQAHCSSWNSLFLLTLCSLGSF